VILQASINRVPNLRDQAESAILRAILDGSLPPGTKLPTIREFSDRFGVSFRTVQQALETLERKGFVRMRHGSGTFVESVRPALTMKASVVLCIETHAHIFGEVAGLLTRRLHGQGRMASLVDTAHHDWRELVSQIARSEAEVFVIHGGPHFDCSVFHTPVFEGKRLIGVVEWTDASLAARIPLAVVDHRLGVEKVAAHLAAAGHRCVLLAGSPNMLHDPGRQGMAFRATWRGAVSEVVIDYILDDIPSLDVKAAAAILRGSDAPTAVFGLRDYDIVCLHRALLAEGIDLHAACEVIGYGNTPWSRGPVAFSTVDWNLEAIAEATCRLMEDPPRPGEPPPHITIAPSLAMRESNNGTTRSEWKEDTLVQDKPLERDQMVKS
jgi:DNA-binding LacI/PurR family transcriptional regulator